MIFPVPAGLLPSNCRTQFAAQPRSDEDAQADDQHEDKGSQVAAPEIAGPGNGIRKVIFFCTVFDVAVKRCSHDRRADEEQEDTKNGAVHGEYGGGIDHFLVLRRQGAGGKGKKGETENEEEKEIESRTAQT